MNLRAEDLASGVLRDRVKVGASLADVDPMNLDTSVSIELLIKIYIYIVMIYFVVYYVLLCQEPTVEYLGI